MALESSNGKREARKEKEEVTDKRKVLKMHKKSQEEGFMENGVLMMQLLLATLSRTLALSY